MCETSLPSLFSKVFLNLCVDIKVQTESFLDIDTDDNKYKNVKVVLVTADCSKTGITNPIDFVVNEGEGMSMFVILAGFDV